MVCDSDFFLEKIVYDAKFVTILFPYTKCVTENRTQGKTLFIGSMPVND